MTSIHTFTHAAVVLLLLAGCKQETPKPDAPVITPPPAVGPAKLGTWNNHYDPAAKLAIEKKLPLLLYFGASDWSPQCQRMDANVLNTKEWFDYARNNVVLVKLDFPRKTRLPEAQTRRNGELRDLWEVNSYPTFLLLDCQAKGRIAKMAALPGENTAAFIDRIEQALASKPVVDEPVKLAGVKLHAATGKGEDLVYLDKGVKPGQWTHDLAAAQAEAKRTKKPILLKFTGSDWCPSCIILGKRVLNQANWQRFARKNLILVVIDFPRKNKPAADIAKRNERLAQEYGVQGYPTLILLQPDGKTMIGNVDLAYSPHGLRKNISKHLRLATGTVDKIAANLAKDEAVAYRRSAADLLSAIKEEQRLVEKATDLHRRGGLTAEFSEKLKCQRDRMMELDNKVKSFEIKAKSVAFKGDDAVRYMKLQNELVQAEHALDKWLAELPAQTPASLEELRGKRQAIQIIKEAIEDMEVARIAGKLTPERKATYQRIFGEFRSKQRQHRSWLESDPEDTPENKKIDQRYNEELNLLEDRLDAIRDG